MADCHDDDLDHAVFSRLHPQVFVCSECGSPCDPVWNHSQNSAVSECCEALLYLDGVLRKGFWPDFFNEDRV